MPSIHQVLLIAAICLHARFHLSGATLAAATEPATPSPGSTLCPPIEGNNSTCACAHEKGHIDLTSLLFANGSVRFTDINGPKGEYTYNYNPCKPYKSEHCDTDKEVHGCQISADKSSAYTIADSGPEVMWIDETGTPFLYYHAAQGRQTKVSLICDQSVKDINVTTSGDSIKTLHYVIDITSCHVCPGGCASPYYFGGKAGVIGIVIILLALIGLTVYFVVGVVIMITRKNATGTDVIPNKTLWFALPFLVKDGCVFTFGPPVNFIRSKISGRDGYGKV